MAIIIVQVYVLANVHVGNRIYTAALDDRANKKGSDIQQARGALEAKKEMKIDRSVTRIDV